MRAIYTVPVHQVLPPDKLTLNNFLMPEAVCCCLQTCKCGFDIRVVLCTSVPSLIVRNANPTNLSLVYKFLMPEAICCRLQTSFDIRVVLCTSVPSLIVRNVWCTKLNRVKPTVVYDVISCSMRCVVIISWVYIIRVCMCMFSLCRITQSQSPFALSSHVLCEHEIRHNWRRGLRIMAVATLGRVEEFDGAREDWQQYVERLEHFFVANSITTPEKKRAVFNPRRACAARVTVVVLCVCVCVCVQAAHLRLTQLSDKLDILTDSVSWWLQNQFGVFRIMASFRR